MAGLNKLSDARVRSAGPGRYSDGGGLYLRVERNGKKRFVWRGTFGGREVELGLGPYPDATLANAREQAEQARRDVAAGLDPKAERDRRAAPATQSDRRWTFRDEAEEFLALKLPQLTNPKHKQQWRNTLADYVFPTIGDKLINEITAADVLAVLRPIWSVKAETARRVMNRIDNVVDHATLHGRRTLASPTIGVDQQLGKKRPAIQHREALPWGEVPAFLARLDQLASAHLSRLALEFAVLTATRSGEVRGAVWPEIDRDARVWSIPGERMKMRRPHKVPLSDAAMRVLDRAAGRRCELKRDGGPLVFPSSKPLNPLSDMTLTMLLRRMGLQATAHGFRSSFRDWAGETRVEDHEVLEACLAHVPSKVVRAYARSDYLDRRRPVMEAWGAFCRPVPANDEGEADGGSEVGNVKGA